MFKQISFEKSVFELSQIQQVILPQLILCGRSNVGKSSFINSLFNRKNLAKTSSTPGKTRSINFFNVDDSFYVVDLPGYGYAKSSKAEREKWSKLVTDFIKNSANIKHAFHFLDCRHNPTELDIKLHSWLIINQIEFSIILNKIDKLSQSDLNKAVKSINGFIPHLKPGKNLFFYSSIKGRWKAPVRKKILDLFY